MGDHAGILGAVVFIFYFGERASVKPQVKTAKLSKQLKAWIDKNHTFGAPPRIKFTKLSKQSSPWIKITARDKKSQTIAATDKNHRPEQTMEPKVAAMW